MAVPHDVPLRSSRDRIIDLLAVGDTYPLTDLNVVADQLKVAFGGTAKIPIENAQAGVVYQLCDPQGRPLGDAFKAEGKDATLIIETPKVQEDVTYRILATKKPWRSDLAAQAARFLEEGAPVKVGIDSRLVMEILEAPLLDPTLPAARPSDPRIVPYGQSVEVQVNKSQEGVRYSLMLDGADKDVARMGDLGAIVLPTGPVYEDVVIQVRATKEFLASENRDSETTPLDAKLYLKVRANPAPAVSVEPSAIIDYRQDATIKIANSQRSAKYRVYIRRIPDAEFVHGPAGGASVVAVAVAGKPDAQVRKPPQPGVWQTPAGYAPVGDAPPQGTGGDIRIGARALTDDSVAIVQALKEHRVDADNPASAIITSAIRLDQVVAVLVRPDPARKLALRMPLIGAQTGGVMQVSNGQPGVFYHFRLSPAGAEFPLPAYFHKRDEQDSAQNKGVGQLAIEIDFAVAADPDMRPGAGANPATLYPRAPLLDFTPFPAGSSLSSRAVKAQTAVEVNMAQSALIAAVPAIRAEQAVIDYGATARILIPASNPQDLYQLALNGAPVRAAVAGNNASLAVATEPLNADAVFEVLVTRPADPGMPVERVVQVPVLVRPDATLPVSAKLEAVAKDTGTEIVVGGSQRGVLYQLMSGPTAVGARVPGTGGDIALPSGPIAAETTFTVAATRADNARIATVLKAQATVKVNPA